MGLERPHQKGPKGERNGFEILPNQIDSGVIHVHVRYGYDRSSLAVAAPLIMKAFKIGPGSMGIALSAFFWAYALFNLPAGIWPTELAENGAVLGRGPLVASVGGNWHDRRLN